jgi:hypothetical protein
MWDIPYVCVVICTALVILLINKWLHGVALYKICEFLLLDEEFNVFNCQQNREKTHKDSCQTHALL